MNDAEIGLHATHVQRKTIETMIDDDKQSDDEILKHAKQVCKQDVHAAIESKSFIKNRRLTERTTFPDKFDRTGRFCDKP